MMKYHGLPITPIVAAVEAVTRGHAFVSWRYPEQLGLACEVCESFATDNSAYSNWKAGKPISNWSPYYEWVQAVAKSPRFDFAIIPDVIDGSEEENRALLEEWPLAALGCPVWHLNESMGYLEYLVANYSRIAIGSSGQFANIGTHNWWQRMDEAMRVICDEDGAPRVKIHGLRMLDVAIYTKFPFASADSTNIARNVGMDGRWQSGSYQPYGKDARARVLRQRIEAFNSPDRYNMRNECAIQDSLF